MNSPPAFPHVSIYVENQTTYADTMDNRFNENHALLLVSVNVYSNKAGTKKSEAKAIMGVIADTMYRMNFRRTMMSPITNMNDTTIFRYTAQFEGVADHDTFYRR